jgi:hypothetical protein
MVNSWFHHCLVYEFRKDWWFLMGSSGGKMHRNSCSYTLMKVPHHLHPALSHIEHLLGHNKVAVINGQEDNYRLFFEFQMYGIPLS